MKDTDTKTNSICFCRSKTSEEQKSTVSKNNEPIKRDRISNSLDKQEAKPQSIFGEWYWV